MECLENQNPKRLISTRSTDEIIKQTAGAQLSHLIMASGY